MGLLVSCSAFRKEFLKKRFIKTCPLVLGLFLLCVLSVQAQEKTFKLRVVTELANIRLKPDIGSEIIHQMLQGETLESTGKEGEWYIVKFKPDEGDIMYGYVHESLVMALEQPPLVKPIKEIKEREITEEEQRPPTQQPIPATQPSLRPPKSPFELYFSGGGIFIDGGDLNSGAQGLADYYGYNLGVEGKGEVKPAHLSYILGGELVFPLSSYIQLGLGVDYFLGEKESRVEFEKGSSSEIFTTRPKIQALPLRLVISFYPLPYFYAKIGAEYYFAKCTYFYRFQKEDFGEEWQGEAKAQDMGFLGGFGFDWTLSPNLSFIVELTGRYAKIKSFEGTDTYSDSEGLKTTEEGILYSYYAKGAGGESYPLLFIRDKVPSEAGVFDPQEAIIDFSGLSLKAGFKIKF
ncbi:MAG: SH3 domain-containing protein [Candidatus Aminicenantes bacterium]|nr:MAG: SH3 domain-containing protein [Candidatus Aminicenantes bacterium]